MKTASNRSVCGRDQSGFGWGARRGVALWWVACTAIAGISSAVSFTVDFPAGTSAATEMGRLIVVLARDGGSEPRFQVSPGLSGAQFFGLDVEAWRAGRPVSVGEEVFGYPVASLRDVPEGDYTVQAVLHRYDDFHLANSKTVRLPASWAAGQNWRVEPGNLFSSPRPIHFSPRERRPIHISLDQVVPPIDSPVDTEFVRHVRIRSKLLSEFWGRDMYLGAHVLVPKGFAEHPAARYPLMVFQGHFPADFGGFRSAPPDASLECDYSDRFRISCYNRIQQQEAFDFYKQWISPDFPRFLVIEIQHANPYYDDSYAVNSENLGPYGDAIMQELIPFIEEKFQGIGAGWARFLYGGSTGGWEALAVQIKYPQEFNGAFAACPDPIDFRAYTMVNLYDDENAFWWPGQFRRAIKPGHRNWLGEVDITLEEYNHYELALGSKGRSGDQWDIWQAVFSPQGEDGYPKAIWDKQTGVIDKEVAAYWRENYDLRYILQRDWPKIGRQLAGKIHIYCGDMDNYYLNNAVYLMEELLEATQVPHYAGVVDYGDRAEHCWNGDHENPNHISRLRYNTLYLPIILQRLEASAPTDEVLRGFRYP